MLGRHVSMFVITAVGPFVAACGGIAKPAGPGSVDGIAFEPAGGFAAFDVVSGAGGHSDVNILLTTRATACEVVQTDTASNTESANVESLDLYLESTPGPASGLPFGPGTYYVSGVNGAPVPVVDGGRGGDVAGDSTFVALDGTCHSRLASPTDGSGAGSVQIDTISESEITGSYSLTFPNGHLQGGFDVSTCAFDAAIVSGTPGCGP